MYDIWTRSRDTLVRAVTELGFPEELGSLVAQQLGSPKAMDRMTAYLRYVKPNRAEMIADEMLAIRSEIDAWKDKKRSQEASASYNELLYYDFEEEENDY